MYDRLKEIEERCSKATPGSWKYGGQGWIFANALVPDDGKSRAMRDLLASLTTSDDDGFFIAHAREDVPWLVRQVVLLAATVERVKVLADTWDSISDIAKDANDDRFNGLADAASDLRAAIEGSKHE